MKSSLIGSPPATSGSECSWSPDPSDYHVSAIEAISLAFVSTTESHSELDPEYIIGIGVGATGSSVLPVEQAGTPLIQREEFDDNLDALVWLWKDHSSTREAGLIHKAISKYRPQYGAQIGNRYSSEWMWSKVLRCKNISPDLFRNSHSFVEVCDYIPAVLTGKKEPESWIYGPLRCRTQSPL